MFYRVSHFGRLITIQSRLTAGSRWYRPAGCYILYYLLFSFVSTRNNVPKARGAHFEVHFERALHTPQDLMSITAVPFCAIPQTSSRLVEAIDNIYASTSVLFIQDTSYEIFMHALRHQVAKAEKLSISRNRVRFTRGAGII